MNRFARTRSEKCERHPEPGRAQCSVGSIDEEGIRYGFTTHALIASTIAIAPAMVTSQSIVIRQPRGSPAVMRSMGFQDCFFGGSAGGGGAGSYGAPGGSSLGGGGAGATGSAASNASYLARRSGSESVRYASS